MPLPQQQPNAAPNGQPQPQQPAPGQPPQQIQQPTPSTPPNAPPAPVGDGMIHSVAPELPGIHPGNPLYQTANKKVTTKSITRTAQRAAEETMAKEKSKREVLRDKIAARKAERKVEDGAKYARLRQVAAEEPKEVDIALTEVAEALGVMAEGLTNLRENLDFIQAPKSASIKVRVAAARKYAAAFKHTAAETPEVLVDAVAEIYNSLDEIAAGLENLATNLGFEIPGGSEVMDDFAAEGQAELEEATEGGETIPEQIEEEVHDPDESEEVAEEEEEENFEEKDASGSDNWYMNNQEKKVETAQIPQVASKRPVKK